MGSANAQPALAASNRYTRANSVRRATQAKGINDEQFRRMQSISAHSGSEGHEDVHGTSKEPVPTQYVLLCIHCCGPNTDKSLPLQGNASRCRGQQLPYRVGAWRVGVSPPDEL